MRPPRVLIVEDDAVLAELTAFVLAAAGFEIESVTQATQAVARILAFVPDLVLMDMQMPLVDGLELTRRLKADPATRQVLVIAFTAFAMRGDEARLRAAGVDGYIAKPFDVAALPATLRAFLPAPGGKGIDG